MMLFLTQTLHSFWKERRFLIRGKYTKMFLYDKEQDGLKTDTDF